MSRTESPDFLSWSPAEVVFKGLTNQLQIHDMIVFPYDGVYLGLVGLFDTVADRQHVELAWSPDSIQWHRIRPGTPLIPNSHQEGDYDWGCIFAAQPIFHEDEIRLYYGGCNNNFFDWRDTYLCLAAVRPGRFAGYTPKEASKAGIVVTRPVICSGKQLRLNANATAGSIRVEVVDQQGRTLQDCRPITGDFIDGPVTWVSGEDLSASMGKPITLRFEISDAKLYAFRFAD